MASDRASNPWGRVDEEGTVYVRTAQGERMVGSWQAGDAEEALDFFGRRYDALVTEVELLEHRLQATDLSPGQARASIDRARNTVLAANAVGDLDSLLTRLDTLAELVEKRREEARVARQRARAQARETKERIVAEAEQLGAEATHWKSGAARFRELVDEWKAAGRADRHSEAELWKRFSRARNQFSKRRKAHFAELERRREQARARKEELVTEAEQLAGSTDWGATAERFRDLMRSWKAAGAARRGDEERLWQRFTAARDTFFQARQAAMAERDAELRANQQRKEELLAEAENLLPVRDPGQARAALRSIQQRWDQVGPVPRQARDRIEGRMRRIADKVRSRKDAPNPEAAARAEETVEQLRSSIEQLERRLERARAQGRTSSAREAEEALTARRAWLAEAERTLAELSGR